MKTEEWKFGYVRENHVYLYNDGGKWSFPIFGGHFLENVKAEFKGSTLRIIGSERVFNYYWRATYREEWESEPRERYIRKKKKYLFFGPEVEYLKGWVEQKELVHFDCTLEGNWNLRRDEDDKV